MKTGVILACNPGGPVIGKVALGVYVGPVKTVKHESLMMLSTLVFGRGVDFIPYGPRPEITKDDIGYIWKVLV
jgi:hypothetical protein